MLQFSIRTLLLGTTYCAIGFAVSTLASFAFFLWLNLLLLQVTAIAVLSVAALEYTGHRRRFCIASLVVLCAFPIWMFLTYHDVVTFNILSIIGLVIAYFAGLMSAGAYRAITNPTHPDDAGRLLNAVTRLLAKILPSVERD